MLLSRLRRDSRTAPSLSKTLRPELTPERLEDRFAPATQVFNNVPEASSYSLVYELPIGNTNNFSTGVVPYSVNNAASVTNPFDRVAYYLELQQGAGPLQYVYVSMDAFTSNVNKIGVPTFQSGVKFQQNIANMNVASNVGGVVTGTGLTTGNLEFWSNDYATANALAVPGANAGTYDFGDQITAAPAIGYGSMQIHNYGSSQTLMAFNHWNAGTQADVGIGNDPNTGRGQYNPDYTLSSNNGFGSSNYTIKNMAILVRQTSTPSAFAPPAALVANAPELANYDVVYQKALPTAASFNGGSVAYDLDNSGLIPNGSFDRVAYYMQLDGNFVEVSFDAAGFATAANKLGVPTTQSGEFYQQTISNMNVASNQAGIITGSGIASGNVEFWPSNYNQANAIAIPNANAGTFDFGDGGANTGNGYGSMQIHNNGASQTLFAFNRWGNAGGTLDLGIGNRPTADPDWTFAQNATAYTTRNLWVLVRRTSSSGAVSTAPPAPPALVASAPELAGYQLVYQKNLTNSSNYGAAAIAYDVNNSALVPGGSFDRVAYYVQLDGNFVEVSFNADGFSTNPLKIGIPGAASGEFYQQYVANMNVASNVGGIVTGTGIATGNVEFWPSNYSQPNTLGIPNASASAYDFGDGGANTGIGYGSMQVHNFGASQVLFAYNDWNNAGANSDLGIGNRPATADLDWTFAANANAYTTKTLYVLVRPRTTGAGNDNIVVSKNLQGQSQYTVNGGAPIIITGGQAVINGGDGNDTLSFDFTNGNPIPAQGISFVGGNDTTGDRILLPNNVQGAVAYGPGSITLGNFGLITFAQVESIVNPGTATTVSFALPAGAQGNLQDDGVAGNDISRFLSTNATFPRVDFKTPTTSLAVVGSGSAAISMVGLDSAFAAPITLGGAATDVYFLAASERIVDSTILTVNGATFNLNGFTETLASLNGAGTVDNTAATPATLNLGAANGSGSFSGVLKNTGAALSLVKTGAGTQSLLGNSTYSGTTTVSQGTLAITSVAGSTPLGTSAVNMAGGKLAIAGSPTPTQMTVGLTGWNQDIIAEKTAANPFVGTSTDVLTWSFYEQGAPASAQGFPSSRLVTSQFGSNVKFQFQPYTANNSVYLPANGNATVALTTPTRFNALQFFASAQGGNTTWNATLNFTDGSTTTLANFVDPDWTASGQNAITQSGLVPRGTSAATSTWSGFYTNNLYVYEHDVALSAADQLKTLASIKLTKTGGGPLMFFALSGLGVESQNFTNPVTVTADSTIDLQNTLSASFGALAIGSNKLTVIGTTGTLAFAGTTVSGNSTFDVAAGVNVAPGAVNDGGSLRTITKLGGGSLDLTAAATSLVSGSQFSVNAGSLRSRNAAALGSATVNLAAGTTLELGASQSVAVLAGTGTVNLNGNTLTIGGASSSYTFGGTIADGTASGSLVKSGTGAITIGCGTYTGSTTIAGTLQVGTGGGGVAFNSASVVNSGALILAGSNNFTVGGIISGAGSLSQSGTGTVTLAGVNSYTGATNVVSGTLRTGAGASAAGGVFGNVPEAAGYTLLYQLPIANSNSFGTTGVPYTVNNSSIVAPGSFSRIGYYLELQQGAGPLQWVYISFDAAPFSTDPTKIGVPSAQAGVVYHYDAAGLLPGQVRNMNVFSNVPAAVGADRTGVTTGNVEFWPTNYAQANFYNVPGASAATYDFGDQDTPGTHGSMQIHDHGLGKTLFAFNDWNNGGGAIGIGSQGAGNPDWTFGTGVGSYTIKNLQIVVNANLSFAIPAASPVTVNTGATLDVAGRSITIASLADGASGGGTVTNSGATAARLNIAPASGNFTFSGVISDGAAPLSLTKSGAGTQTLAGTSTYSGNTAVAGGVLKLGANNALPVGTAVTLGVSSTSGQLDLGGKSQTVASITTSGTGTTNKVIDTDAASKANAFTLNVASGSATVRNILSDAVNNTFSLRKIGTGTLVLSGTNAYAGDTIVDQGTLQLAAGLQPGARIMPLGDSITDGADGGGGGTNAGYRGPLYNLLTANGYSTVYVGSANTTPGVLPAAQQKHEGHSGWVTGDVATGILHGVKTTAAGGLGWLTSNSADVILLHIGTNNTGGSEPQSIADVSATLDEIRNQLPLATTFVAQIIPKTGATAFVTQYNIDLAALVAAKKAAGYNVAIVDMNTTYPAGNLPDGVHPNAAGYNFMANQWYAALSSATSISGNNVLPTTTNLIVSAGATVDLNGVSQSVASLADGTGGGTVTNTATSAPVSLTFNGATVTATYSGVIADAAATGAVSLVKTGAGAERLVGNNTYRGTTTVSGGALVAGSNNALGATSAGTIVNVGGTLGLQDVSGPVTLGGESLQIDGLGAPGQPGALANISGANAIAATSPITVRQIVAGDPAQVGIGSTAGTLTVNAAIDLKSSKLVVNGAGDTVINGAISSTGAPIPPAENVGAVTGVFNNVPEANTYVLAYEFTAANNINGANPFPYSRNNSATIQPYDRVAYYLELQSGAGALQYVYVSMNSFTANVNQIGVPNGATLFKWQQTVSNMNVFSNVAGISTGTGKTTGNIEIWPSNYAGSNDIGIPNASASTFDFGDGGSNTGLGYGSFQVHNYDIDGVGPGTAGQTLFAYNNWRSTSGDLGIGNQVGGSGNPDYTFANNLPGYTVRRFAILVHEVVSRFTPPNNALDKNGTGTLTLAGANTYTGGTTVNGGRLLANNATSSTGPGAVDVNSGGTLGGNGTITGPINVHNGGTLAPGSSPGTLTASANVTFDGGSFFNVDINGPVAGTGYDQLVITGSANLSIAGGAFITGSTGYLPTNTTTYLVINKTSTGTTTGTFTSFDNFPAGASPAVVDIGGKTYSTNYNAPATPNSNGQSLLLTAVPATRVWDGGGATDNWSDPANWAGDNLSDRPFPGDSIVFDNTGAAHTNSVNDLGYAFNTLTLSNTSGNYTISGSAANFAGGVIATNSGSTDTISLNLTGAAGLSKSGGGTLAFLGINTYTDGTLATGGTLLVNGSVASGVAVSSPAVVGGTGTVNGNVTGTGAVAPGSGGPGTLTVNGNVAVGSIAFDVNTPYAAANVDRLIVNGTVDLSGTAISFAGTGGAAPALPNYLTLIANNLADPITTTGATSPANGATVTIGGTPFRLFFNTGDGNDAILVSAAAPAVAYASPTWSVLTPGAIIPDADFGTAGNQPAIFGVDAFTTVGAALGAVTAAGQVIVNSGVYPETVNVAGTRTLTITSGATVAIDRLGSIAGTTVQINGTSLTVGDAGSSSIDAITGPGSLIKQGSGTVTLAAANLYAGGTTINGGALLVNGSLAAGAVAVNSGGTLGGTGTIGGSVVASGTGRVSPGSDTVVGTLTVSGSVSLLGASTLFIQVNGAATDLLRVLGSVTINSAGATLTGVTNAPPSTAPFAVIDGGTGFSGTFQNATAQPFVTLAPRDYTYAYTGPAAYDFVLTKLPGIVEWDGGSPTSNNFSDPLNWVGDGLPSLDDTLLFGNLGLVRPNPVNDFATVRSQGMLIQNTSGAYTISGTGILLTAQGLIESGVGGSAAVNLPLSGTTVTVTGGALTLGSTANSYAGNTTVTAGRLTLGASGVLPDGAAAGNVVVNGTLDLAGFTETINGLTGSGFVNNSAGSGILLAGANNATSTFSGVLQNTGGSLALTKIGGGTLTLAGAGANTYTGTTTVNDGVLALAKSGVESVVGPIVIGDGANNSQPANVKTATPRVDARNQIAAAAAIWFTGGDGRLHIAAGVTETIVAPAAFAQGDVKISGTLISNTPYSQTAGASTTLDGGVLRVGASGTQTYTLGSSATPDGVLQGSGTIYTDMLTSWGTIDPSSGATDADFGNASPGIITVRGNLQMTPSSVTNLDVSPAGSDQLNVGINTALALPAGSYTDLSNYDLDPYLRGDVASVTEPIRRGVNDIYNVNGTVRFNGTLNVRPMTGSPPLADNVGYGNSMNFVWRALDLPVGTLNPRGGTLFSLPSDFTTKNSRDAGGTILTSGTRFDQRFLGSAGQLNAIGQAVNVVSGGNAVLSAPAYILGQAKAMTLTSLTSAGAVDTTVVKVTKQVWNAMKDSHTRVTLIVTNTGTTPLTGPFYVELLSLPSGASAFNAAGKRPSTSKPYLIAPATSLAAGASVTLELDLLTPLSLSKLATVTTQVVRGGTP